MENIQNTETKQKVLTNWHNHTRWKTHKTPKHKTRQCN